MLIFSYVSVSLCISSILLRYEEMLNDTETYEKINKDPTKKLTNEIREVLTV